MTETTLAADAATLAALADSLAALDRAALGAADRAALDTLAARVGRERAPLDAGAWRRDPGLYLALAHDAPLESARRPHVNPCERARRASARLRWVPEVLRAAEVNLGPAALADSAAAARWREAAIDLRSALPALVAECHDAERYAAFVEADTLALDAVRHFARFLDPRGDSRASGPAAR